MAKSKVKLKSSVTATPVAPKLAGPNTKLMPHIQARKELNDLRDALTEGKVTREEYETFYPPLADKLFEVQEKNGFEMDLDGIRENYYNPPEINPTHSNLLGPLPKNENAEMGMPVVSAEAGMAAAKQLEAEKYARANPEPWRPKAEHTGRMTPQELQEIRDEWEYYNTTPAQKYYDTGGQKQAAAPNPTPQPMVAQAAPQTAQPQVAQAVHPLMQKLTQAAQPTTQPATAAPTTQPAQPNTNSNYFPVYLPKPSFANAGNLIKKGTQLLGGAGLVGGSLKALEQLLGTSQPPERTLEEDIANDPRFNFDPKAPPGQR